MNSYTCPAKPSPRPCPKGRGRISTLHSLSLHHRVSSSTNHRQTEQSVIRLTYPLCLQPPGKHERQHFPIAHERPKRMRESCGPVPLDEKMRNPRASVTWNQDKRKQPPFIERNQQNGKAQSADRPGAMKQARRGLAVLAEIIGPEIIE